MIQLLMTALLDSAETDIKILKCKLMQKAACLFLALNKR